MPARQGARWPCAAWLAGAALASVVASGLRLETVDPKAGSTDDWGSFAPPGVELKDMACFLNLARYGLKATDNDVVFRAGHASKDGTPEVLVLQKDEHRYLIFKGADGACNGQAGTICGNIATSGLGLAQIGARRYPDLGASADTCDDVGCTADTAKTVVDQGAGYIRSMAGAMALLPQGGKDRRFLSVGLGAGTLALLLQSKFPEAKQTVVELSPEVVSAAKCFGAGALDIVTGDGRQYIDGAEEGAFDAVLIDVFDGADKVPGCFTTGEFFKSASRKLKPGGVLVMNAHSGQTLHNDLKDLLPGAKATFPEVRIGDAPGLGNKIVLATSAVNATAAPGVSLLARGASAVDGDLNNWLADAMFAPAGDVAGPVRADADVQCGR